MLVGKRVGLLAVEEAETLGPAAAKGVAESEALAGEAAPVEEVAAKAEQPRVLRQEAVELALPGVADRVSGGDQGGALFPPARVRPTQGESERPLVGGGEAGRERTVVALGDVAVDDAPQELVGDSAVKSVRPVLADPRLSLGVGEHASEAGLVAGVPERPEPLAVAGAARVVLVVREVDAVVGHAVVAVDGVDEGAACADREGERTLTTQERGEGGKRREREPAHR